MVSLRDLFGMGSSHSKDERKTPRPANLRHASGHLVPGEISPSHGPSPGSRLAERIYAQQNGSARGSRHDLSFLHIGRGDRDSDAPAPERPRETKQEREARRVERERQVRLKERERSMREESVDGGYLVTVGVYTGPEDFSKPVVRQLQIERRIAPFWRGLNDHQESWTEAQLVAVARGLPIPAPDEIPPDMVRTGSQASSNPRGSDVNMNNLAVPIPMRSQSYQSDTSASLSLSTSHPAFSSNSGPSSPTGLNANNPLFRGRAKTLASTLAGKISPDLAPPEITLPRDPYVNGQPVEAYLYKDAVECPICFMYYPPYLNRTRCCDQFICSECFVQIKRPDPHPPEHEQPGQQRSPEEQAETLVSEVAACPFCVRPEFGVTYEPPPFRRGLAYAHQQGGISKPLPSAISSPASLEAPTTGRRRGISLSADSSQVITTDRVRPDWAKKLADARAHALRRSAAATALHNAAYVLGNQGDGNGRSAGLIGRRRRTLFGESPSASGSGTPREGDSNSDLPPGRGSSRRPRVEDLEELMMMEAIRLSLATEEERKKKEEKEAAKEQKKRSKAEKKAVKRGGGREPMYRAGTNDSTSTWASTSMARSTSNLGQQVPVRGETVQGKGKQPVQDFAGSNPLSDPTATTNREVSPSASSLSAPSVEDAQRHLEESRANLQPTAPLQIPSPITRAAHTRNLSDASSTASSFVDSPAHGSFRGDLNVPSTNVSGVDVTAGAQLDGSNVSSGAATPATTGPSTLEPMLNFRSLTAMMNDDDKNATTDEHVEDTEPASQAEEQLKEPSPTGSPRISPTVPATPVDGNRSRGDTGESSSSAPPPIYVEAPSIGLGEQESEGEKVEISPVDATARTAMRHDPDSKEVRSVDVADHGHARDVSR